MPSLSQKHRPQSFADVTGQAHVTETLRKEIASGVLGHAFLFCGPRGVGKTTTARIFAKALNCLSPKDGEPDNTCERCIAASEGRQFDLIELDAATHNGVDTVRESIIEHVRFAPMAGARKVYVLDEAHMLTPAAWNALLKTLEEPPAYAFFILATTEWHKVPATIVSRCQRFEFKRVPQDIMSERIKFLAKEEGWKIDEDVVRLIVSRSEGCVRDAETLLGQLGSLGETHLSMDVAELVVPMGHMAAAAGLLGFWARRDHAGAMDEAKRLSDEGIPLIPLFDDLVECVRRLLVASSGESAYVEEYGLKELAGVFSPGELNSLALLLFERRKDAKGGLDALFALQLAGTVAANGPLRHAATQAPPVIPAQAGIQPQEKQVPKEPEKTNPPLESSVISSEVEKPPEVPPRASLGRDDAAESIIDINRVRSKWQAVIRAVDEKNHSLPFILKISKPEAVQGETVIIRFQYGFHRDKLIGEMKNKKTLEEAMQTVFGIQSLEVQGVVGEDAGAAEKRSDDVVSNILKAFGGSVVES